MDIHELNHRLERIETLLSGLVEAPPEKAYYSTSEVAEILDRKEWTVREHCRLGRIRAEKRLSGNQWMISHEELLRVQNEGLLPLEVRYPR